MLPGGRRSGLTVFAIAVGKVHTDFDKAFDFSKAHTWGWNPKGAGDIMVALTPDDDPVAIKRRIEPFIMSAVKAEMPRRGLAAAAGAPDLTVTYYALITIATSAQTLGQFLPAVTQWGIPPFTASTTSLEMIEQGSLVLDLSANGQVVWRGIGQAQIKLDLDQDKRNALIREAVQTILERYPPKK